MHIRPYPYQRQSCAQIEKFGGRALLALDMGLGKAQPLDSRLLTPTGWTFMEDIHIGDDVIGSNGHRTKVTGVFPQGEKTVYRITFKDKSSTECCDEHLWAVSTPNRRKRNHPDLIMSLHDLRNTALQDASKNNRFFIPIVKPVEFEPIDLPLDPYLVGYLIANGGLGGLGPPGISSRDKDLINDLRQRLPPNYEIHRKSKYDYKIVFTGTKVGRDNPITLILRKLGLARSRSFDKKIPFIYRYNSLANRVSLFQGLMDGDGTSTPGINFLSYTTVSQRLANHVRELVQSFGGTAKIRCNPSPKYTYKGEVRYGRPAYTVGISLPNEVLPFKVARKALRYPPRPKYVPSRAIIKIEEVGKKPCQCITVDAPDNLYVTDNYILTHNSAVSLLWAYRNPDIRPVIIVCPASLKWQWQSEARKHFGMRAEVLETRKPPTHGLISRHSILIINYDILAWWVPYLRELKAQLIIADEVHFASNRGAKRSKALRKLCKGVPHAVFLSGTPLTNRPSELFNALNILWPKEFPSFFDFGESYCAPELTPWGWQYKGAENLDDLHNRLISVGMIRKLKKDVLDQLPNKQRTVLPLDIDNRKEYDHAVKDFLGWLRNKSIVKANRAKGAQKLVKIGYLKRLAGKLKFKSVVNWIEDFLAESDEKLIVFGMHHEVLHPLHDKFPDLSVLIDGTITGKKRQQSVDLFLSKKRTRLMFGNIQAAGVGWSAKGITNTAFVELPWTPGALTQAEDRTHGIGRGSESKHSNYFYLVARNTIESRLCEVLQEKQMILDATLDGKSDGDTDLDIYDKLTSELLEDSRRVAKKK